MPASVARISAKPLETGYLPSLFANPPYLLTSHLAIQEKRRQSRRTVIIRAPKPEGETCARLIRADS
jgi:hypothetical protein